MQYFPVLDPEDLARIPPRAVLTSVRWMIRMGNYTTSWGLTKGFFERLPRHISPVVQRVCQDIMHLHLLPRSGDHKKPTHYQALYMVSQLLSTNSGLRPNADTLFHLLRSLRYAKNRTVRARRLVARFEKKWGPEIVDNKVRRRVASFALSEYKSRLARSLMDARMEEYTRQVELAAVGTPSSDFTPYIRPVRRPPRRLLYPRRGVENRRWLVLFRRAGRMDRRKKGG